MSQAASPQTVNSPPNVHTPAPNKFQPKQATSITAGSAPDPKADVSTKERPIWLPEKFKTEEAMAKAYLELEKEHSRLKGDKPDDKPAAKAVDKADAPKAGDKAAALPSDGPDTTDGAAGAEGSEEGTGDSAAAGVEDKAPDESPKGKLAAKGLDLAKYEAEFLGTEALSKESRAELNAAGFTDSMIDTHIAGAKAQEAEMLSSVGITAQEIKNLVEWTAEGLTKGEQAAYTKLVESKDIEQIKMGLAYAKSKYDAAHGKAPKLTQGRNAPMQRGYESGAQLRADIADPRYSLDPAFRDKVDAKMKRSDISKLNR